jgi:predicted ABC-type ATPase
MSRSSARIKSPVCLVIAGPNGAGKTTFAREFLPREAGIVRFVNADLIAGGLSPLRPSLAAAAAGRVVLSELDRLAKARESFAFESTLSGLAYAKRLARWKALGYRIQIVFLKLDSPELALKRIAARVQEGGHDVPKKDVLRRFERGLINFQRVYAPIADYWELFDNSGGFPRMMEKSS